MREIAAFIVDLLVGEPNSVEAREIRRELADSLQDDQPLLRALVSHTQIMRDVGGLTGDEAHYLIAMFTEHYTFHFPDTDPVLLELHGQMRAIEAEHGLDEDSGGFMLDEAPPEWLAVNRRWDHRLDHLWASLLCDLGEPEMAATLGLPVSDERWSAGVRSLGVRALGDEGIGDDSGKFRRGHTEPDLRSAAPARTRKPPC